MTLSHQTPPTLTVYVPVKASDRLPGELNRSESLFLIDRDGSKKVVFSSTSPVSLVRRYRHRYEWLDKQTIPDHEYIGAIVQDMTRSPQQRMRELEIYFNSFC